MISKGVRPDTKYLQEKLNFKTLGDLKAALLKHSSKVNLKELAEDLKSILFKPSQADRITNFTDQIDRINI